MIIPSRRRFLFGAGALLAAPAIVRVAANLMPVSTRAFEILPAYPAIGSVIRLTGPGVAGEYVVTARDADDVIVEGWGSSKPLQRGETLSLRFA